MSEQEANRDSFPLGVKKGSPEAYKLVGLTIRVAMERQGITIEQASQDTGIPVEEIKQILSGKFKIMDNPISNQQPPLEK